MNATEMPKAEQKAWYNIHISNHHKGVTNNLCPFCNGRLVADDGLKYKPNHIDKLDY